MCPSACTQHPSPCTLCPSLPPLPAPPPVLHCPPYLLPHLSPVPQGEGWPPPPKTAIAGPEYFGFNQAEVGQGFAGVHVSCRV